MKKFLVLAIFAILLTGCGNSESTVSCTKTTEMEGFTMIEKNQTTIKNGKAYSTEIEIKTTPEEEMREFLDMYAEILDDGFTNVSTAQGITYSSEIKDYEHILKMSIEYAKLNEDEIAEFNEEEKQMVSDRNLKNVSAEETKNSLEKEGYTCEIK